MAISDDTACTRIEREMLTAFRGMSDYDRQLSLSIFKARAAANKPKRAALHLVISKSAAKSDLHRAGGES